MPRSEVRGLLKDAVPIYLLDAALASAFVARWWCCDDGVVQLFSVDSGTACAAA
jgi:hypothetical protein